MPESVKRLCPECEAEVSLTIDPETGDREGRCPKCKLDVGAVVNRLRYEQAKKVVEETETKAKKGKKTGSSWF